MDFLRRHYEKVLLVVALIALIICGFELSRRVRSLSSNVEQKSRGGRQMNTVKPMNFTPYTNAVMAINTPPQWEKEKQPLFFKLEPPPQSVTGTTSTPVLVSIEYKPFKLLFKAYSYIEQEQRAYSFQINLRAFTRTFFVSEVGDLIRDQWEDTGYQIKKFEKKSAKVFDGALGREMDKDVSELTLQYKDEPPIVLVYGRQATEQEPVAKYRCGVTTKEIRRRQRFNCGNVIYYVVDISGNQMVIRSEVSGKETTLSLPASGQ